jgi:cystathionine beta-lyase
MHSITKYIGGHSDVMMGALICNNDQLAADIKFVQNSSGAIPGPQDCFLVLRGIKTLHLRMQRHCDNGAAVARYLKSHPKVDFVNWPGFEEHANHDIASAQMRDFGGMLSFSLKGNKQADSFKLMSSCKLFTLAESLGGVESLICHPASMTHASIPKEDREKAGIVDSLIRFSVGVEDINDLIADLDQALKSI